MESDTRIYRQQHQQRCFSGRAQTTPIPRAPARLVRSTTQRQISPAQNHHFVCLYFVIHGLYHLGPLDPCVKSPCGSWLHLSMSVPLLVCNPTEISSANSCTSAPVHRCGWLSSILPVQGDMRLPLDLHQTNCTVRGKIPTFPIVSEHEASESTLPLWQDAQIATA